MPQEGERMSCKQTLNVKYEISGSIASLNEELDHLYRGPLADATDALNSRLEAEGKSYRLKLVREEAE